MTTALRAISSADLHFELVFVAHFVGISTGVTFLKSLSGDFVQVSPVS
jgi:hypothetical protein